MAVNPRIKPVLTIFEPRALPRAKSGLPSMAAIAETTISGADVPKPTMTIPINKDGIPACLAVAAAPSTKRSALQTNRMKPPKMAKEATNIRRHSHL